MAKNINDKPFDEGTLTKLSIFRKCFEEWLPVFINQEFIEKIYIYDFFAGSGYDKNGAPGSPIILLDVAKGDNMKYCKAVREKNKKVLFAFNEYEPKSKNQLKYELLKSNITNFILKCKDDNCGKTKCIYEAFISNKDFKEGFNSSNDKLQSTLRNKKYAKFILLDQYGFSQVDKDVFLNLVRSPTTDFIFFISSSFIKRFKEHPNTKKYIETHKITFDESNSKKCHIAIAEYFEHLLPNDVDEYYINHFTINKNGQYYGLIFGTNHSLGMEKFLKVCWEKDPLAGESTCNTQNDFDASSLFGVLEPNKIQSVKSEIKRSILNKEIKDNISGLKFALKKRCLPRIFTEVVKELEKKNLIIRDRAAGYKSTNIHQIKKEGRDYYLIIVNQHEDNKN